MKNDVIYDENSVCGLELTANINNKTKKGFLKISSHAWTLVSGYSDDDMFSQAVSCNIEKELSQNDMHDLAKFFLKFSGRKSLKLK